MFRIFKKKKKEREMFESFLIYESLKNPSLSLEEGLDKYIKKHSLLETVDPDLPKIITEQRLKLEILENSIYGDPKNYNNKEYDQYLATLRMSVLMFNELHPETIKILKENESKANKTVM